MESTINLEVVLKSPPCGVGFCLQKGRNELEIYIVSDGNDISFSFPVRVKQGKSNFSNFLGEYIQVQLKKGSFIFVLVNEQVRRILNGKGEQKYI